MNSPDHRYLSTLILSFIIFVNQSLVCFAQEKTEYSVSGYHIKHYTDENGLPQNSVKSITRDSRGNIWLATERGLVRFDGNRFVRFNAFEGSFSDRNISGFYLNPEAVEGDFLAMTQNKAWIRISEGRAVADTSLKGYPLRRSVNARKPRGPILIEALPDLNENSLTYYRQDIIPIYPTTNSKHFAYDEQDVSYYVNNKLTKLFPFPGKSFFRFFCLGDNLYYLDEKLKLTCFSGDETDLHPRESMLDGFISAHPGHRFKSEHQIFWNNSSHQAFVLMGRSLYLLQPTKNGALTNKLVLEGFDFQGNDIKTVYFDQETGRLFLGSQLHGLYIVTKKSFRTVTHPLATFHNVYYGQELLDDKNIVTAEGVVFSLDNKRLGAVAGHLKLISKAVDWDQYSILKSRSGSIWCKRREKLFQFDGTGERILSTWTINDEIKLLYEGRDGRIWIGTNTLGLYYIDPLKPDAQPRFFAGKHLFNISWIQHQTNEMLWIGTGKGLYRIDLRTKKTSFIKGLGNIYIRSLYIPNLDEIWITTYTSGIFLLKNGKLSRFPLDKEQYLASAHCILEDKRGFFWITTNKGLFQIKRSDLLSYTDKPFDLYYHYYSKIAGFNTNEFNGGCQPCALRTPGGLVSVPSIDGLVWFVPERIRPELPHQQIFVDDWENDDSTSTFDQDKVSVRAGVPQIVLKVTTPYFGDSYNLRISYRIFKDGKPLADWNALEENMRIAIPFKGGGNYKLSIRKVNGFGVDNYDYKHLDIYVEKQWHETWWFRSVLLAAVLLVFYGILKQRIRKITDQNLILEAKVKERTRHLEETLRGLNTSEKELERQVRTQIRLIASITHDVRNPVRHTAMALRYVQDLMEKKQLEAAINAVKKIGQNSDRIYHLIDDMVSFIKPEVYKTNADFKSTSLYDLVHERIQIFKDMSNGTININISSGEFVNTDPKLLGVVIHNLVDNAIKVKKENRIEIDTERKNEELYLVFSDHGPGMPAELIHWLNTVKSDGNTSLPASYEGLGLLMIKEITRILNVSVHAENNPGACIRLKFVLDINK